MTPDVSLDEVGAAMIDPEPPNADQNAGRPWPEKPCLHNLGARYDPRSPPCWNGAWWAVKKPAYGTCRIR
jgi:hypothetical protein